MPKSAAIHDAICRKSMTTCGNRSRFGAKDQFAGVSRDREAGAQQPSAHDLRSAAPRVSAQVLQRPGGERAKIFPRGENIFISTCSAFRPSRFTSRTGPRKFLSPKRDDKNASAPCVTDQPGVQIVQDVQLLRNAKVVEIWNVWREGRGSGSAEPLPRVVCIQPAQYPDPEPERLELLEEPLVPRSVSLRLRLELVPLLSRLRLELLPLLSCWTLDSPLIGPVRTSVSFAAQLAAIRATLKRPPARYVFDLIAIISPPSRLNTSISRAIPC
jgi:hypothetical protein